MGNSVAAYRAACNVSDEEGQEGPAQGAVKDSASELAGGTAKTGLEQEDCAQGMA